MASMMSILKTVINFKCLHVNSVELDIVPIRKHGCLFSQEQILIHACPFKRLQGICPVCRKKCTQYDMKDQHEVRWRAPNLNGIPTYILYQPRRIDCPEHGALTEWIPWADGNSHYTPDFNNEVAWLVTQMSKKAVSEFIGINWRTVGNCVAATHSRLEPDISNRLHGLKRICVDETSYRVGYSYITVVYDMDRNRVAWAHEGYGKSVFEQFCKLLTEEERSSIEIVAGDGARWISDCTKEFFPNATRCIDFFHVVEWANEALDKVRISVAAKANRAYEKQKAAYEQAAIQAREARENAIKARQEAMLELETLPKRGRPSRRKKELLAFIADIAEALDSEPSYPSRVGRPRKGQQLSPEHQATLDELKQRVKDIKGAKIALGHNPENCTDYQHDKIKLIENEYPDLYQAYQMKEALRLILHMTDGEQAKVELMKWINDARTSGLPPMADLAEKVNRNSVGIINSVVHQANSAKSESANTTIKVLIKLARGFRNVSNMLALIYLRCSDIVIPLHNRPSVPPEIIAEQRNRDNQRRRARAEAKRISFLRSCS